MVARSGKTLTDTELEDALEVLQDESDRACAVLGAAHLEYLLAKAILKAMPHGHEVADRLFNDPTAPLGTFAARIDTAYAMSLIDDDAKSDLHSIRNLRNDFAHDLQAHSFEQSNSIRDRCRNLKRGKAFAGRYPEPHRTSLMKPRNLFISTVVDLQDELRVLAGVVERKPERVLMSKKLEEKKRGK